MFRKFSILAIVVLLASPISAHATTINFGEDDETIVVSDLPINPYTQDGYTFSVGAGTAFGISGWAGNDDHASFGAGFVVGFGTAPAVDDYVSIKRTDGGLFTFDYVDYASNQADINAHDVKFVGRLAGNEVFSIALAGVHSNAWARLVPLVGGYIDELQIVVTNPATTALKLDNFVFSEVPLPAAVWMFLAGLGGLGFARGKKRSV